MNKLLDGLVVLDFTSRLPGPMAGYILTELGAQVIKVETSTHPDPFKELKLAPTDKGFQSWYSNINKSKNHFTLEDNEESLAKLQGLCKKAHIILMGWPQKIQEKFELTFNHFQNMSNWGSFLELSASHEHDRPMHDLNVLAEKGYLSLHIKQWEQRAKPKRIAPPFLPFAGATFAQAMATKAMAASIMALKNQEWINEKISLEEAIDNTWNVLYSDDLKGIQDTFLHSGRYPCYNIYPLINHRAFLAVACIEEKYWNLFTEAFDLELTSEDRFNDKGEVVFSAIQNKIAEYDVDQMKEKLQGLNCCLSLISME